MLKKLFFTAALSAFALWGAAQTTISGENCGTSPMTHGLPELMQMALQQMASPSPVQNGQLIQIAKLLTGLNTPNA